MATIGQLSRIFRRRLAPENYARLAAELCPELDPPPEQGLYPDWQEKRIAAAVYKRTGISPVEFLRLPLEERAGPTACPARRSKPTATRWFCGNRPAAPISSPIKAARRPTCNC